MTRRKLKISKLQITKTKDLQSSQEEKQIPHLPPYESSQKKTLNSKYENKKLSKFI
jgi:hypothetical protein